MKRFSFRMDRLLHVRSSAEQQQARQLGEALRAEETERGELETAEATRERAKEQLQHLTPNVRRAGVLVSLERTVDALESRADAARAALNEATARVETQRECYRHARQERRALERLRERQYERWAVESAREEQMEIDEVAARIAPLRRAERS